MMDAIHPWIGSFPRETGEASVREFFETHRHPADLATGNDRIASIASAPFVRPSFVTSGSAQYLAFYNERRILVVASRGDWGEQWEVTELPSQIGWDSHNYPSIGIDRTGTLHLAANMHAGRVEYFRTDTPGDAATFRRIDVMVNPAWETSVTYPEFLEGPAGELTFWFRDGKSGDGVERRYRFDEEKSQWRAFDHPVLMDGEGERSAYLNGNRPMRGADGRYHVVWVWRDSPDAASNHSISYARSEDLDRWENVAGEALDLPLRYDPATIVGECAPGSGVINNNVKLAVKDDGEVGIVSHRRDATGRMQIVYWRYNGSSWHDDVVTRWDAVWNFDGTGSLAFAMELGTPYFDDGGLSIDVRYENYVATLRIDANKGATSVVPAALPWCGVVGVLDDDGVGRYLLVGSERRGDPSDAFVEWQALPQNRDREISSEVSRDWLIYVGTVKEPAGPMPVIPPAGTNA